MDAAGGPALLRALTLASLAAAGAVAGGGCDRDEGAAAAPGARPAAPVEVGVVTLQAQRLPLVRELPGRTSAFRVAEVRARVDGIVLERLFVEGSDVKAGQRLFRLDAAPYQAAAQSAQAQVARAQANVASAAGLAERYGQLVGTRAISKQEHDDTVSRLAVARAELAAARAALRAARIDVQYATVVAPVAGRIGRAEVTEGAYVQRAAATLLATVQQLDPCYVDLSWSSAEVLRLRRAIERGEIEARAGGGAPVTLLLEDGQVYPHPGTLQFTDAAVDPGTGSVTLRALFPNPGAELLPGMYVRARVPEGVNPRAILVPQAAVTRDQNGRPTAIVVGPAGQAERRVLTTDREVGNAWLVTAGVAAGERVVVEGLQRVKPGAAVVAVPAADQGAPASPGSPPSPPSPPRATP